MWRHLYAISILFSRNWPGPGPWVWLRLWEGDCPKIKHVGGSPLLLPLWSPSSAPFPPAQSRVLRGPPMEFRSHRGGGNSTLESIHALSPALLCHTKQCHGSRSSAGHCICARRAIVFVWTSNCIWSPGHHWKYRISGAFPHAIVMTSVSDVVTIITAVTADPRLMLKNAFIH